MQDLPTPDELLEEVGSRVEGAEVDQSKNNGGHGVDGPVAQENVNAILDMIFGSEGYDPEAEFEQAAGGDVPQHGQNSQGLEENWLGGLLHDNGSPGKHA